MSYELAKAYIQIIPTTKGIKGTLDKELGSAGTSAGKEAGSGFGSSFGSALKKVGKASAATLVAGVTAMAAFTKSSVEAGMNFDEAMSQVAATMSKTMDDLTGDIRTVEIAGEKWTGNLRDYAKKMGAETKFSATEAADALNYMALAGYDTQTSMEMLPNVLNLAAAQDYDSFYKKESAYRRLMSYPPFSHLLSVQISSTDMAQADGRAAQLRELLDGIKSSEAGLLKLSVLGPNPAAIGKLRDVYRRVIYARHRDYDKLIFIKDEIERFLLSDSRYPAAHTGFDFDPMDF